MLHMQYKTNSDLIPVHMQYKTNSDLIPVYVAVVVFGSC